jgi:hypothetical protein
MSNEKENLENLKREREELGRQLREYTARSNALRDQIIELES